MQKRWRQLIVVFYYSIFDVVLLLM